MARPISSSKLIKIHSLVTPCTAVFDYRVWVLLTTTAMPRTIQHFLLRYWAALRLPRRFGWRITFAPLRVGGTPSLAVRQGVYFLPGGALLPAEQAMSARRASNCELAQPRSLSPAWLPLRRRSFAPTPSNSVKDTCPPQSTLGVVDCLLWRKVDLDVIGRW
jgi:hypothetical protein